MDEKTTAELAAGQLWAETVAELKAARADARGLNLESFWRVGERAEAMLQDNRKYAWKSPGDLAAALGVTEEAVWTARAFHRIYSEAEMRKLGTLPHLTFVHIGVLVRVPDPVERARFQQQMADGTMKIWDLERILENRRQAKIAAERKVQKKEEIRALRAAPAFRMVVCACGSLYEACRDLDGADQEYRRGSRTVPFHVRFQALKERHAAVFALYAARGKVYETLQRAAGAKELAGVPVVSVPVPVAVAVPAPDADEHRVPMGDLHSALFADYYEAYFRPSERQKKPAKFTKAVTTFRKVQSTAFGAIYAFDEFGRGLKELAQMPEGKEKAEDLQKAKEAVRAMRDTYLTIIEVVPRIVHRQNPPEPR